MLRRYLVSLVLVCVCGLAASADVLQKGDVVAICGDSITEQKLYSLYIEAYLTMCRAGEPVYVIVFGQSGDSMSWYHGRGAAAHVLASHPTVVTTCYGMNDGRYAAPNPSLLKAYQDGMDRMVENYLKHGVRVVVVGSPGVVDVDTFKRPTLAPQLYNQTLANLRDAARELAEKRKLPFANVYDPMLAAMTEAKQKYGATYHLAGKDGIHPSANGHMVMAYAFLKAMGMTGEIGALKLDMASGKADASQGHRVIEFAGGELTVESSRYPFCTSGKPDDPASTAGITDFVPFHTDLNRLTLTVSNAPAKKLRVTWGETSKLFTAEELSRGINLAEHFVTNPFSNQFSTVLAAIAKKQEYETWLYKEFFKDAYATMTSAAGEQDPSAAEAVIKIREALIARDATLARLNQAMVTPVTHRIRIAPVQGE